jgi:hypothetical protein
VSWEIRRSGDVIFDVVRPGGDLVARIKMRRNSGQWSVSFEHAQRLDWTTHSLEEARGYVRGVERAAQVHGAETGGEGR